MSGAQVRHEELERLSKGAEALLASNGELEAELAPLRALPPDTRQAQERVEALRDELRRSQAILDAQLRAM